MMQAEGGQIASFREIHKNAWLKRIPPNSNNKLLGQKKVTVERWWIVFCVHGDVEPYLEGYTDAGGAAAAHMPRWRAPLSRAIHVSGSVGPAKPHLEYEFVVALQDGAIRLIAPSWESMQDWVDTLRNKLREMKILSPKENVYSKPPEQARPRAPTRDPTSPLPAPPPGPVIRVPGTEPSTRPQPAPSTSNERTNICDQTSDNDRLSASRTNSAQLSSNTENISNSISPVVESDEEKSQIENSSPNALENTSENAPVTPRLNDINSSSSAESSNCKKDRNVSKHKNTAHKSNSQDSNSHSSKSTSNLGQEAGQSDYDRINDKFLNDTVSKIEMDFSKLVFNNDCPFSNRLNFGDDEAADDFNISNDFSNLKMTEFTSSVANVSGMNICLTDSVLEHRIKSESDKDLFTEFDIDENLVIPSTSASTVVVTDPKDPNIKYSKVDLKAKKFERFKQSLLSNTPPKSAENEVNVNIEIKNDKAAQKTTKSKPAVTPRTIIFNKNCDNGGLSSPTKIQLSNDNHHVAVGNVSDDDTLNSKSCVTVEKKKTSTKSDVNVNNADDDSKAGASNVTIITVSNDAIANVAASAPMATERTIKIENSSCGNNPERSYVNVSLNSDLKAVNKIQITPDTSAPEKKDETDDDIFSVKVTKGSGYGHIRHTTTIGVKNNEKDEKTVTTASNRLSPVNNTFQANICDTTNVLTLPSPTVSSPKLVNTSILEIEHKPSNSRHFSFEQPPRADSSNSVKLINITSPPNTPNADQFYESVFTPFTRSKNSDHNSLPSSSNESDKMNKISKNYMNPHNYEFLAWKDDGSSNQENVISICRESRDKKHTAVPEINLSEYRPQPIPNKYGDIPPERIQQPIANNNRNTKHGLFTRGLTELNIVSKFRNMGQSNSSRAPLLKNSQFYSYVEIDPSSSSSSSSGTSNVENNKKNGALTAKLNHLFNKTADSNVTHNKTPDIKQVLRIESSLRRNWSEHNDRTMLPVVKTAAELKAHRSRAANTSNIQNTSTGEERQIRRRSSSLSESHSNTDENSCSLVESPKNSSNNNTNAGNPPLLARPMGLREQQVARLRGEMAHAGGVRLRLRTRDCPGEAMALADGYGTVWICGWKQRTHPLLYNALHIGDRLASVSGVPITSVRQAKSALKDTSPGVFYVELVIKRLPHGRAYTLKKESDNQDLGLILDSATIVGIVPGSPAAQAGVTSNGTLTEVNGRPLNLLLKKGDTQVRDRLNAIGRDVSILVQPTEFVALLRASLRNMRSHKDYIVQ